MSAQAIVTSSGLRSSPQSWAARPRRMQPLDQMVEHRRAAERRGSAAMSNP